MYVCVLMYVCKYACMLTVCARICEFVSIYMYVCKILCDEPHDTVGAKFTYIHTCMHTCIDACIRTYLNPFPAAHIQLTYMHTYIQPDGNRMYVCMYGVLR